MLSEFELFPFPYNGSFQLQSLQIFSQIFSLSFFWEPYNANVGMFNVVLEVFWGFPGSLAGKESPAMQETLVQFLGQEDPLEKG